MNKLFCGSGYLLALGMIGLGIGGCGGANAAIATPFVGKTYSKVGIPLAGGAPGNLLLMVQKDGQISGNLVMTVTLPGAKEGSVLQISYPINGQIVENDGSFSATFENKPYRLSGTLPSPPSISGGKFSLEAGNKTYGPFPFGTTP